MKKEYLFALVIGSLIPDIDFILLPFSIFNSVHRYYTHNIFFLMLAGTLMLFIVRTKDYRIILIFLAGGLIHLFLDAILDANPTNGIGVPMFWPVHTGFISPFNLLNSYKSIYSWEQPVKFIFSLGKMYLIELPFIALALFLFIKKRTHAL